VIDQSAKSLAREKGMDPCIAEDGNPLFKFRKKEEDPGTFACLKHGVGEKLAGARTLDGASAAFARHQHAQYGGEAGERPTDHPGS
jgi:hypothetical protein